MGDPVKIVDLARDMIRLSGLAVGEEIEIVFVGPRPGEKIREELLIAREGAAATRFDKIFRAPALQYDFGRLAATVARLTDTARANDDAGIRRILLEMNIGFCPPGNPPGNASGAS